MWTQVGKGKVRRTKKVALIHIHTHTHPFVVQSLSCAWLSATPETASTSGIPVLHHLLEVAQIHVCRVGDAVNYHVQNRWLVGSYSTAQGALWWPGGAGESEVQEEGDICRHSVCVCVCVCETVGHSVLSNSLWPNELQPSKLLCPWNSPGQNTGVSSLSLLQEIFPTQGLNPGHLHCRQTLYHLSP